MAVHCAGESCTVLTPLSLPLSLSTSLSLSLSLSLTLFLSVSLFLTVTALSILGSIQFISI